MILSVTTKSTQNNSDKDEIKDNIILESTQNTSFAKVIKIDNNQCIIK